MLQWFLFLFGSNPKMLKKRILTTFLTGVVAIALATQSAEVRGQAQEKVSPASFGKVDFERDILPIFEKSCFACHGATQQMLGLRLDAKRAALVGSDSGKVIQPHNAAESPLYRRVAGIGDQTRMPMGGDPLDAAQIELIRTWIDQGADWPDGVGAEVQKHWAYVPPKRPPLPKVSNRNWSANPIDSFVLARLEKEGLSPSSEADRVTLMRRLSLAPASACFNTATICSTLNRLRFTANLPSLDVRFCRKLALKVDQKYRGRSSQAQPYDRQEDCTLSRYLQARCGRPHAGCGGFVSCRPGGGFMPVSINIS